MSSKYLFMVFSGLFLYSWFWFGNHPYFIVNGVISTGYLVTAILVMVLGGGDSEGSDLISVLTSAIMGFMSRFMALAAALLISRLIYEAAFKVGDFSALGLVHTLATLAVSGSLIILTVACLKKAS